MLTAFCFGFYRVLKQFQEFYNRPDTFSLGICNGCQLMALLGWVPATANKDGGVAAQLQDLQQPRLVHNKSGRWVLAAADDAHNPRSRLSCRQQATANRCTCIAACTAFLL
jgi:phosphoribosylformylglycinamidine synthase